MRYALCYGLWLLATPAWGEDYYRHDQERIRVVTQQLSFLHPPPAPPAAAVKVFLHEWERTAALLEPAPRPAPVRRLFRFDRNWPQVAPSVTQRSRQEIQTVTQTQVLWGVVQQQLRVENGTLVLPQSMPK